ncbi:MAG: ACP S-malonyltransferase [Burkholderiaceae bacterium]
MAFAFVFPGQGSQSVGMFDAMIAARAAHPSVAATLEEASDILKQDLVALIASGPIDELGLTTNTQPVMLAAGVAMWRAWRDAGGGMPAMMAGHSLGEYAALVAAGVLTFADALPLVRFRAEAMQAAVPVGTGGMAAILGLDDDAVRAACVEAAQGEVVEPVNFNAPSQVVIAGHKAAVERACEAAKARGAKRAVILAVSAPFHSSLMRPAADRLAVRLADVAIATPTIAVVNNVDVRIEQDATAIRSALVRQAASPVRWAETIRSMADAGVTQIVECGPGKVLAPMCKRIDPRVVGVAIFDPASLATALEALQ